MKALVITNSITRRDTKAMDKYLAEVSQYDLLTPEKEVELFQEYRNGSETAFRQIVNSNLRFVISVAKQYQYCNLPLLDLISEGNLGLIKAVERFDETKGFKFISYAVWWIRQSILQAIGEKSRKIRVPQNHQSDLYTIIKCKDELTQKLEREPSLDEISLATEMSIEKIEKCLESQNRFSSLDAPIKEGEDAELGQFLQDDSMPTPDEKMVKHESLRQEVEHYMSCLDPRERSILSLYYGIGEHQPTSLSEISRILDISRERVRQVKERGLRRLRKEMLAQESEYAMN